ncbi:Gonadotropin-releasing hormone II receptor [Trichinella spiralis]|uniref:Gonadotropin-releasing hormone II receptor n=1 Tax=Trichinella spiralis TaxID=6334 RepID=A0ABR3K8Z3_TRISP
MGMCNYSKLILALFVFSNVTFVRSAINQTNETSILNSTRPYNEMEVTLEEKEQNYKIRDIHDETMDQQQLRLDDHDIKKILNLPGKNYKRSKKELQEKTIDDYFEAQLKVEKIRIVIIIFIIGLIPFYVLVLLYFNVPEKYAKYLIRKFGKTNRYCPKVVKSERTVGQKENRITEKGTKLQLE